MIAPLSWLKDYVDIDITPQELEEKLFSCGFEVEELYEVGKDISNHKWCITTNLRVLIENDWLDDLQYICVPTEHHVKRVTVKFTCDRGVSHEFVRHRVFSFAQESTRQWRH